MSRREAPTPRHVTRHYPSGAPELGDTVTADGRPAVVVHLARGGQRQPPGVVTLDAAPRCDCGRVLVYLRGAGEWWCRPCARWWFRAALAAAAGT